MYPDVIIPLETKKYLTWAQDIFLLLFSDMHPWRVPTSLYNM
jgi:hypothetical protein